MTQPASQRLTRVKSRATSVAKNVNNHVKRWTLTARWTLLAPYMRPKKQPMIEFKHLFLWMTFLTLCAVCCAVTVEAVVMGRDVTNSIKTRTLVVVCAPRILNAPFRMCVQIFGLCLLPAAVVAMVAIRAVAVFNALRRTYIVHTGLKILRFC